METYDYPQLIKAVYDNLGFWQYVIIEFDEAELLKSIVVRSRISTVLTLGVIGGLTTPYYIYLKGPSPFVEALWLDVKNQNGISASLITI